METICTYLLWINQQDLVQMLDGHNQDKLTLLELFSFQLLGKSKRGSRYQENNQLQRRNQSVYPPEQSYED